MVEYICLDCAEEFELDNSSGRARCPDCLAWRGVHKSMVYAILEAIYKEEQLEDA